MKFHPEQSPKPTLTFGLKACTEKVFVPLLLSAIEARQKQSDLCVMLVANFMVNFCEK